METAAEIQAAIKAGLVLAGREEGQLQWMGTREKFQLAKGWEAYTRALIALERSRL